MSQTYDGAAKSATATTVPAGLAVDFTYDGAGAAPVGAQNIGAHLPNPALVPKICRQPVDRRVGNAAALAPRVPPPEGMLRHNCVR